MESQLLSHLSGKTPSLMIYVTMLFESYPNSKTSLTLNLRNVLIRLALSTSMNKILREFNLHNLSSLVPVAPLEETTTFPITPAGSESKEVFIKVCIVKGLGFINHYTSNIRIIIDKSKPYLKTISLIINELWEYRFYYTSSPVDSERILCSNPVSYIPPSGSASQTIGTLLPCNSL